MRNRNITALVTGSAGFIGRHLCRALLKHPDVKKVIEYDNTDDTNNNIRDPYEVANVINCQPIDIIFHLASTTTVPYNKQLAYTHVKDNVFGTEVLLENAPKGCRFVFTSSVAVYGDRQYKENKSSETDHTKPNSIYAATKVAAEQLIGAYSRMGLIDGICLRLTSVVGKDMTHGCVKDFLKKIKCPTGYLDIWGKEPGSARPFIHVDDVVRALIYFGIEQDVDARIINISTPNPISIKEVALEVLSETKTMKTIRWLNNANTLGDVDDIYINNNLAVSYGYIPNMASYNAIRKAIKENL